MRLAKIKSIKLIGNGRAFNICMDKNKNFILANGILTHNTRDAQAALKRTMELYSNNCRFILTANNKQSIIEPIVSRCGGGFEFQPISKDDAKRRLIQILSNEGMSISDEAFNEVHSKSFGDFRQILNNLQTLQGITKNIELKHIKDVQDNANYILVLKNIQEKKYTDACKIITKYDMVPLYHSLISSDISGKKKGRIAEAFAEINYRMQFAVTDFIQLHALVYMVMNILNEE